jgi:hypothetical protein
MREVLTLALDSFEANRKSYHLSCNPSKIPTDPTDDEVAELMDASTHDRSCTSDEAILSGFGTRLYQVWNDNEEEHYKIIADHFVKHLTSFTQYALVASPLEPYHLSDPYVLQIVVLWSRLRPEGWT